MAALALSWLLYAFVGHALIRSIYEGQAGPLNRLITRQDLYPVHFYLNKADQKLFDKSFDLTAYLLVLNLAVYFARKKRLKRLFAGILVFFVLTEGYIHAVFTYPALRQNLPVFLLWPARDAYTAQFRSIQGNAERSRYDGEISYTLKPGNFIHSNVEYSTRYSVNSLGLRDDEDSLRAPEVIVLGDSFTMGMGVEQHETYSALVERESGLKTLNAGVSSYATVREMLLLGRLDTSRLKHLIIQYCPNDDTENEFYRSAGNKLTIMTREVFEANQRLESGMRYFPGKHTLTYLLVGYRSFKIVAGRFFTGAEYGSLEEVSEGRPSVDLLLNAVKHAGPWQKKGLDPSTLRVLVLADRAFCENLKPGLEAEGSPLNAGQTECVDVYTYKKPYFLPLDMHWNHLGHQRIAGHILQWLQGKKPPSYAFQDA